MTVSDCECLSSKKLLICKVFDRAAAKVPLHPLEQRHDRNRQPVQSRWIAKEVLLLVKVLILSFEVNQFVENNNVKGSESGGSRASSRASPRVEEQRLARTISSLSSDSMKSQVNREEPNKFLLQPGSGCGNKQGKEGSNGPDKDKKPKLPSPPKKAEIKASE